MLLCGKVNFFKTHIYTVFSYSNDSVEVRQTLIRTRIKCSKEIFLNEFILNKI